MNLLTAKIDALLTAAEKHFPYAPDFKGAHHIIKSRETGKPMLMIYVSEQRRFFWIDLSSPDLSPDPEEAVLQIRKEIFEKYPITETLKETIAAPSLLPTDSFEELLESEKKDPSFRADFAEAQLKELKQLVLAYLNEPSMDGRPVRKQLRDQLLANCLTKQ